LVVAAGSIPLVVAAYVLWGLVDARLHMRHGERLADRAGCPAAADLAEAYTVCGPSAGSSYDDLVGWLRAAEIDYTGYWILARSSVIYRVEIDYPYTVADGLLDVMFEGGAIRTTDSSGYLAPSGGRPADSVSVDIAAGAGVWSRRE
jgi:hypothetical protein